MCVCVSIRWRGVCGCGVCFLRVCTHTHVLDRRRSQPRQSFDSIDSTRLQVARDGHGRTAPARVVLSGRGVVTEWRVHACGESRGVPDCRSVQHDALKPERLGLLCGSESEAHGAHVQVSALRAARLRRPRRLSASSRSFSDRRTARGAPKSYLPRGQIGRFPCPNMIPRRTVSSDYAISHLRFSSPKL